MMVIFSYDDNNICVIKPSRISEKKNIEKFNPK